MSETAKNKPPFEKDAGGYMGDWKRGAPLGRANGTPGNFEGEKVSLRAVPLDSGGYDRGGAYWGHHQTLYCAYLPDGESIYLRAPSRERAKEELRKQIPDIRFYR